MTRPTAPATGATHRGSFRSINTTDRISLTPNVSMPTKTAKIPPRAKQTDRTPPQ
jgi:hypothetical protein